MRVGDFRLLNLQQHKVDSRDDCIIFETSRIQTLQVDLSVKFNLNEKRNGHLRKNKPDFIDSLFKIATWE